MLHLRTPPPTRRRLLLPVEELPIKRKLDALSLRPAGIGRLKGLDLGAAALQGPAGHPHRLRLEGLVGLAAQGGGIGG